MNARAVDLERADHGKTAARTPPDSPRSLRLGFVGVGWIGRHRLAALLERMPSAEIVIADPDARACEEARALVTACEICPSLDDMLSGSLDGVVIATPNMMHEAQCLAALEQGVPVFCQKPLAPTSDAARRIVQAAESRNILLAVDWSYRWLSGVRYTMDAIAHNRLGRVHAIDLVFHNAWGPDKPWFFDRSSSGGGCLVDLGVHLMDLAVLLTGECPSCDAAHIAASGTQIGAGDATVEDFAWAQCRTRSGCSVRLACSWNAHIGAPCRIACEVLGSRGGIGLRNVDGSFHQFETHHHDGTTSRLAARDDGSWGGCALADWAFRVADGNRFDPDAWKAVDVATLLEEIYRAGGIGRPCDC